MPTNRALWPARRSTNSPAISLEIDLAHLNVARFFHESPLPPKQLGKGHIGVMIWNWYKAKKRQHFTRPNYWRVFFQMYFHDFSWSVATSHRLRPVPHLLLELVTPLTLLTTHIKSHKISQQLSSNIPTVGQRRPYKLNIPWAIWSSWSPHLLRIRGHWREPLETPNSDWAMSLFPIKFLKTLSGEKQVEVKWYL